MPSPFPGMDPFLEDEKLWPGFQHHFIGSLMQILLPNLVDRYRARISQRQYCTEMPLFTSIIREQHVEEYVEVRHRNDNRLVTVIEMASPTNKNSAEGRAAYTCKRKEFRSQGATIVEIDLVMQGEPLLEYSREGLPEWDYAVTVSRCQQPDRYEIYTATLQKRLPRFKLPLALDDRDIVVDLQAVFARCFDQANFLNQIDYTKEPRVVNEDSDRRWVHELLVQSKMRAK
ncbi:MAG TPA: DUF4058 family protein [Gemmataceae bacterium]|nr:DUF4058 family protein [Gemmataceae bacterium]